MKNRNTKSEIEKLYGAMLINDEAAYPLCDFQKLCGAVKMKDEDFACEWYNKEYLQSCFASSSVDKLRRQKNGFIVLIGYMRSTVMCGSKRSELLMLENLYIRLVEGCADEESIFRLFITAFRDFCGRNVEEDKESRRFNELSQCTDYISANIKTAITLSEVALYCGYNPSYLSRKFKQVYGISVKQYIMDERLKAAAAMLRYSDKSIAEISSFFKFSSQSHFQREFKRRYNITPMQYRNNFEN